MRPPIILVCLEWSDVRLAGNKAREVIRVLKC